MDQIFFLQNKKMKSSQLTPYWKHPKIVVCSKLFPVVFQKTSTIAVPGMQLWLFKMQEKYILVGDFWKFRLTRRTFEFTSSCLFILLNWIYCWYENFIRIGLLGLLWYDLLMSTFCSCTLVSFSGFSVLNGSSFSFFSKHSNRSSQIISNFLNSWKAQNLGKWTIFIYG